MAPPARPPKPAPVPDPVSAADALDRALQTRIAGVNGTVRSAVVKRLQTLAETHPDAFRDGVRRLLSRDS